MATSIIKKDNGIDISTEITVLSGSVNYARYHDGLVYISFITPPFASTDAVELFTVPTKYKPHGSNLAAGILYRASSSDNGYGQVEMDRYGRASAWYSKQTQYGIYGYLIYHT